MSWSWPLESVLLTLALLAFCCGHAGPAGNMAFPRHDTYESCPKPEWVDQPIIENAISAVGIARSAGGTGEKRAAATAAGRDVLARILSVRIKQMTDRFVRESADLVRPGSETAETFSRSISRQITDRTLQGSRSVAYYWDCVTGEMNALVRLDTAAVVAAANYAVRSEANAPFLEGKADEAIRKMGKAIREAFGVKE